MADTRKVSSRELVEQKDIQFIRSQTLELTLIEARPRTRMNVFFDNEDVTRFCAPAGNERGTPIITDSIGQAQIEFFIPSGRFNTGNYEITITDASTLDELEIPGSKFGSATGSFSASGELEIFQKTVTTITTVTREKTVKRDPLAQSFFTFGEEDGIFLSSIEVYFATKDEEVPVRCEIRPLINGFPGKIDPDASRFISRKDPSEIGTSDDASLPTKFTFNPPLYLNGDAEYCFVLRSNSNNYSVFTSRMGETSLEDGRSINEQPFVGTLFKSENNVTWSAFQFEDIKFKINRANFDASSQGSVLFKPYMEPKAVSGNRIITENGSNRVRYQHKVRHGLEAGSKIHFVTFDGDLYTDATLNGIPYSEIDGTHTVISAPDSRTVEFDLTSDATSSGPVESSGVVTQVNVVNGGSGYEDGDTVSFSGGGGSGASGVANVSDGEIQSVTLTDSGSGYTREPLASVTSTSGTGATLTVSVTPPLSVFVNKPMTAFQPRFAIYNYGDTSTRNILEPTIGNYPGGNLNTYSSGSPIQFVENNVNANAGQNLLVASRYNEDEFLNGDSSALINISLNSSNNRLSPVIDTIKKPTLRAHSHRINAQEGETLDSSNSSASVSNILITASGSGYTATPTVEIDPPELDSGTQATADAIISGGVLTGINVTDGGSGYLSTPLVRIVNDPSDTDGDGGAAQAIITDFNSELLATGGNAEARYVTKKTGLSIPSNGVRLFCILTSVEGGYVDWYIRTSSSSSDVNHDTLEWKRLECDESRDQSEFYGQFLEYEFNLDGLSEFDVYDLKCVMGAEDPTVSPIIEAYRVIVTA
jgi:hypothetical protein